MNSNEGQSLGALEPCLPEEGELQNLCLGEG